MGIVELGLDKAYIEKTMKEANKRGMERYSGDKNPENWLRWEFKDDMMEMNVNLEENRLELMSYETPIGNINLGIDLNTDDQIHLLELMIKRLNKFKAMLETLK